jgi:hypothetical protein
MTISSESRQLVVYDESVENEKRIRKRDRRVKASHTPHT